jgi:hypothetical protein
MPDASKPIVPLNHANDCRDQASCNCPPGQMKPGAQNNVPTLTPISRMFLMIAGAMFGLLILKYFGVETK